MSVLYRTVLLFNWTLALGFFLITNTNLHLDTSNYTRAIQIRTIN